MTDYKQRLATLQISSRKLALEADMFMNNEGGEVDLEEAILEVERLTQGEYFVESEIERLRSILADLVGQIHNCDGTAQLDIEKAMEVLNR